MTGEFDVNHEHEVRLQAKLEASKRSHELDYSHHNRKGYKKGMHRVDSSIKHHHSIKNHGKHGDHKGRYKHRGK